MHIAPNPASQPSVPRTEFDSTQQRPSPPDRPPQYFVQNWPREMPSVAAGQARAATAERDRGEAWMDEKGLRLHKAVSGGPPAAATERGWSLALAGGGGARHGNGLGNVSGGGGSRAAAVRLSDEMRSAMLELSEIGRTLESIDLHTASPLLWHPSKSTVGDGYPPFIDDNVTPPPREWRGTGEMRPLNGDAWRQRTSHADQEPRQQVSDVLQRNVNHSPTTWPTWEGGTGAHGPGSPPGSAGVYGDSSGGGTRHGSPTRRMRGLAVERALEGCRSVQQQLAHAGVADEPASQRLMNNDLLQLRRRLNEQHFHASAGG